MYRHQHLASYTEVATGYTSYVSANVEASGLVSLTLRTKTNVTATLTMSKADAETFARSMLDNLQAQPA